MIKATKINDIVCKPIKIPKIDPNTIKGKDILYSNLYPNIFCVGSSGSGKTSLLLTFIKHCIDKNSKVVFFVSTFYNDDSYRVICDYLEKKGIEYEGFEEIGNYIINFTKENADLLKASIEAEKKQKLDDEKYGKCEEGEKQYHTMDEVIREVVFTDECIKVRAKKPKLLTPKYLFVFDDISQELRKPIIKYFMKHRRHYKVCNWISSQNVLDLDPHARNNVNISLLFGSINTGSEDSGRDGHLLQYYNTANLWVPYSKFEKLYKEATSEPYHFLYVNKDRREFLKDFHILLE